MDDFISRLRVSENEAGKYEYCKGKWVFGSREMDNYGSNASLECVEMVKLVCV